MATPKGKTQFAEESAQNELTEEQLAARNYMADEAAWDADGEEFGGKADILILKVGEIAGPLTYVGHQKMTTSLGETTVHLATNKEGETMRLPIQATFLRSIDQGGLVRGDTFLVKRFEDQIKKQGKGAGNPMAIYGVKIKTRSVRPLPASA